MGFEKEYYEIDALVKELVITIKQRNRRSDYFINSLCEDIFIDAFNKIFDCDFKNLNISKPNAPAVDLFDKSKGKKALIQVTSDNKPQKLYDTISKCVKNIEDYKDYKKIYLFVLKDKTSSYKQKEVDNRIGTTTDFSFNINEHIFDIYGITNLLKQRASEGLSLQDIIEVKEGLDKAINGLKFKYKELKAGDKDRFSKSNYLKKAGKSLDRQILNIETKRIIPMLELFENKDTKYVFLVSSAGFGKSFSLNDYFDHVFEKAIKDTDNLTPFLLNFKDISVDSPMENHIVSNFHERKNPLLIIDGFDEIGNNIKQKVEDNVIKYLKRYSGVRCLLSGRNSIAKPPGDDKTAVRFENYELMKLEHSQVTDYLQHEGIYDNIVSDENYRYIKDSILIPFNLYNISEYFKTNRKLEKSILFISHKRINEDIDKYCNSKEMLSLRSRLSLERLAVINGIIDSKVFSQREIGQFIEYNDDLFAVLKNSNLLNFDDINETVRFSNNNKNYEDLLIAYSLLDKEMDALLKFFSYEGGEPNIPISWFNSISMLVSLHGLESDISKNLTDKFPFILVNAEDFGLSSSQREQIFQAVFNHYEEKDIWIDNAMYEESRYAKFGDNDLNFQFLIDKIQNPGSNFRTKSKAISLLRLFTRNKDRCDILYNTLTTVIIPENRIGDVVSQCYYCLAGYKDLLSRDKSITFVNLSSNSKDDYLQYNEQVRAAVYYFIIKHKLQDRYVDYLLEGLKLLDKYGSEKKAGRGDVTFMDEGWHLDNAFAELKNKTSIVKVIKELYNRFETYDRYHSFTEVEKILNTARTIIDSNRDNKIFIDKLISVFSSYDHRNDYGGSWFNWKEVMNNFKLDQFIIEKLRGEKAILHNLLNKQPTFVESFHIVVDVVGSLTTENSISEIYDAIDRGRIEIQDAMYLWEVGIKDENLRKELRKKLIAKGANFTPRRKNVTTEENADFQKQKFDLLFDKADFLNDLLNFFANSDEIESRITEIPKWYKDNFYHSDLRLEFLRHEFKFGRLNKVHKSTVLELFSQDKIHDILNRTIFEKMKHQKYSLSEVQRQKLTEWVQVKAKSENFRNAIHDVAGTSFNVNMNCVKLLEYKSILDIKFDKETSFDLLSFDHVNYVNARIVDRYENYFEKIIDEIDDLEQVKIRVNENLQSDLKFSPVLDYHIIFSSRHNVTANYELIEKKIIDLLPELQKGHLHDNPLLVYYEQTKKIDFLSKHFPTEVNDLFWTVIDFLIGEGNHQGFVDGKLNEAIERTEDLNLKLKLASELIKNNSIGALEKFVFLIKKIKESGLAINYHFHEFSSAVNAYGNEEIKAAIDLIELTYIYQFDDFENPKNAIMGYFVNLIKERKENFTLIRDAILTLINEKNHLLNIQFLETHLPALKNVYNDTNRIVFDFKFALKVIEQNGI